MPDRERHQDAGAAPVDEPGDEGCAEAGAERDRAGAEAGNAERAADLAQEQQHREAVDPEREPRERGRREQDRDARSTQNAPVAGHSSEDASAAVAPRWG